MAVSEIIERIAKLRRLASSDNLHEAQAAAAAAAKLADKYRISEAEIEAAGSEPIEHAEEDAEALDFEAHSATWKQIVVSALCKHYGCATYLDAVYEPRPYEVNGEVKHLPKRVGYRRKLVGRASDVAVVRYMYAWLTLEFTRLVDRDGKGKGRTWRNSWLLGAAQGIADQLAALATTERRAMSSVALVKLDDRAKEAEARMNDLHPKLRAQSCGGSGLDKDAFGKGKEHGASVHLGQHLGQKAPRALGTGS